MSDRYFTRIYKISFTAKKFTIILAKAKSVTALCNIYIKLNFSLVEKSCKNEYVCPFNTSLQDDYLFQF